MTAGEHNSVSVAFRQHDMCHRIACLRENRGCSDTQAESKRVGIVHLFSVVVFILVDVVSGVKRSM